MLYLYVAIILISETIAISFLREYYECEKMRFFLLGILFYGLVSITLVQSLRLQEMGIVNVIWSVFSVVFVAVAGRLEFKERLTHTEIFGIALAVSGIAILSM